MNKCPKCGHTWPDKDRAKGGKARWKGTTKKTRSAAASKAAKARWAKSENRDFLTLLIFLAVVVAVA